MLRRSRKCCSRRGVMADVVRTTSPSENVSSPAGCIVRVPNRKYILRNWTVCGHNAEWGFKEASGESVTEREFQCGTGMLTAPKFRGIYTLSGFQF
jgi:hypothetical protein